MNWVDVTLIVALALFGLRGYFRGLFREVLSIAGLVVGLLVAVRFYETVAAHGEAYWNISPLGFGYILCLPARMISSPTHVSGGASSAPLISSRAP